MMSAIERAQDDVNRGHLGIARQRLASYMATQGYDADLAARIGQISYDMRDLHQAGRYWLLSTAEGQHVDEAIDHFLNYCGDEPSCIVGALPRMLRLPNMDDYPDVVRRRLRRFRLEDAIALQARQNAPPPAISMARRAMGMGCCLTLIASAIVFIAGLHAILNWLRS